MIDACEAAGINILDCWMAGPNVRSNIGAAIRGRRDRWIIQTKRSKIASISSLTSGSAFSFMANAAEVCFKKKMYHSCSRYSRQMTCNFLGN